MIRFQNVSFTYENGKAGIFDIDFTIRENECVALIGESGNGKTTITRILNGLAPSHYRGNLEGGILINGKNSSQMPLWEQSKILGNVFQDPKSGFFSSDLHGEVAFTLENYGVVQQEIKSRTDQMILSQGLESLEAISLDVLSSGEKQRVAIASMLVHDPKVLVFDEPTANLDEEASMELGKQIKTLKEQGHTIVIAEHRLAYLSGIIDRYIYIRSGRMVRTFSREELEALGEEEKSSMGIRTLTSLEKNLREPIQRKDNGHNVELRVEDISCKVKSREILRNTSFQARSGEVIAITGVNGAGKTTLAKIVNGIRKESSGTVKIQGKTISKRNRCKQVWYASNDTNTQFFTNSLTEELLLLTKQTTDNIERARALLKEMGLYEYKDCHPQTLSGGQKQRLSIACGIFSDRPILIFDEPTSGLDGKNLNIIAELFTKVASQGKVVLVITHDRELMNATCTREVRITSGKF
ncbi:MAG: ABC transporter ATP-binding protein [Eubacteriales bacterium]